MTDNTIAIWGDTVTSPDDANYVDKMMEEIFYLQQELKEQEERLEENEKILHSSWMKVTNILAYISPFFFIFVLPIYRDCFE